MRVVIDTNVMVSAYLGGALEKIQIAFKNGVFTLIVSKSIIKEYFSVLRRPKFKIRQNEIDDFASLNV